MTAPNPIKSGQPGRHCAPLSLTAALLLLVLGGCAVEAGAGAGAGARDQTNQAERLGSDEPGARQIAVSPNRLLGSLSMVDPSQSIAVLELQPGDQRIPEYLVARDATLRPTAVLRRSGYRRGRAFALTIIDGQPQIGDQVVIPETADLARMVAAYAPGSTQSSMPPEEPAQEVLENLRIR